MGEGDGSGPAGKRENLSAFFSLPALSGEIDCRFFPAGSPARLLPGGEEVGGGRILSEKSGQAPPLDSYPDILPLKKFRRDGVF